jgi:hypothetical protein
MPGRHRFNGEDRTIRPLLAAAVPVVAVAGMAVAAFMGGVSPATSTARIEVPRFAGVPDATSAPALTTAALPSALPVGAPMIMNISESGSAAIQRIKDERAEAARRAEQQRQARAAEAAREREAAAQAARDRAAQEARQRAAPPPAPTTPAPTPTPSPTTTPDTTRSPAPSNPRGLLDSLLSGRNN